MSRLRRAWDEHRPLWIVGGVAAGVRLVWVLVMSRPPAGLSDPILYLTAGEGIAAGEGYRSLTGTPTSYYPPGYPYFVGIVRWLIGLVGLGDHVVLAVGIVQALLGGVAAAAVLVVGRRLGGPVTGWVAGLILALWPNLVIHSSLFLSEPLFLALAGLSLVGVVRLGDQPELRWGTALATGAALGAATLVRPQSALVLVPAAALAWAAAGAGWRRVGQRVGLLVAVAVVVVAPWTIRNAVVLGGLVPVSTNTGDNLCVGFHEGATGGFAMPEACDTGEFYTDGPDAELRRDAETRRRALAWARSNVAELPALSLRKVVRTFEHDHDGVAALEAYGEDRFLSEGARDALRRLSDGVYWLILLGALTGCVLVVRSQWRAPRDPAALLIPLLLAGGVAVPVFSFGDARFKVAFAPCLALLAAVAWTELWRVVRARRARVPS